MYEVDTRLANWRKSPDNIQVHVKIKTLKSRTCCYILCTSTCRLSLCIETSISGWLISVNKSSRELNPLFEEIQ
jgi:hypothetical protein